MKVTAYCILIISLMSLAYLSLCRVIRPEIYLISIILLASAIALGLCASKRTQSFSIFVILIVALMIRLSFALASGFTVLPRGDGYRYFMYTRYIYESGRIDAPEKIFGPYIVHWPFLHVLSVELALIFNLDLYIVAQFLPPMVFSLVTAVFTYLIAKLLCKRFFKNAKLYTTLVFLIVLMNDGPVFNDTNFVGRSLGFVSFMVVFYLLFRASSRIHEVSTKALLIFVSTTLVLTHPYQATIAPIMIMLYISILLLQKEWGRISTIKGFFSDVKSAKSFTDQRKFASYPFLTSLSLFILQYLYIFYVTKGAQGTAIDVLKSMFTISFSFYERHEVGAWLASPRYSGMMFKSWWIEGWIAQLAWFVTFLFYSLAAVGFITALLKRAYRKRFSAVIRLNIALAVLVFIETYLAKTGPYIFHLATPLLAIFVALAITEMVSLPKKRFLHALSFVVLSSIVLVYTFSAATSVGSRVHIPSYIYTNNVSFEDKGMHSTYGPLTMAFLNSHTNYEDYNSIFSDDTAMVRALVGTNASDAFGFTKGLLNELEALDRPKNLVVVLLNLKVTYEGLRDLVMRNLVEDYLELKEDAMRQLMHTNHVYDSGHSQVYLT